MEGTTKFLNRKDETHDSASFLFEKPADFDYVAGQYMFFTVAHDNPDERGVTKHFTLSSSPTEDHLMFTTKFANPGSTFKQAIRQLAPGTEVPVRGANGSFVLPEDSSQSVVFLGGGIGITPFRSMIRFATDQKLPTPITLLYANKSPGDIVYKSEFDEWAAANPNFQVHYTVDAPDNGWQGDTGHLTGDMIKKYVPDLSKPIFYICGPAGMVTAYKEILQSLNISDNHIVTENFSGY